MHEAHPGLSTNVVAVVTTNVAIVYVSDQTVNPVETQAWNDRFGHVLTFKNALPNPDKRFKRWFRCTSCYAKWILGRQTKETSSQTPPATTPGMPVGASSSRDGTFTGGVDIVAQLVLAATSTDFSDDPVTQLVLDATSPYQDDGEEDVFGHMAAGQTNEQAVVPALYENDDEYEMFGHMASGQTDEQAVVSVPTQPPQTSEAVVLPVKAAMVRSLVPGPTSPEPLRALNLYLSLTGNEARFEERESAGIGWEVHVHALGLTASGQGPSKKAAKRNAVTAFLQQLGAAEA